MALQTGARHRRGRGDGALGQQRRGGAGGRHGDALLPARGARRRDHDPRQRVRQGAGRIPRDCQRQPAHRGPGRDPAGGGERRRHRRRGRGRRAVRGAVRPLHRPRGRGPVRPSGVPGGAGTGGGRRQAGRQGGRHSAAAARPGGGDLGARLQLHRPGLRRRPRVQRHGAACRGLHTHSAPARSSAMPSIMVTGPVGDSRGTGAQPVRRAGGYPRHRRDDLRPSGRRRGGHRLPRGGQDHPAGDRRRAGTAGDRPHRRGRGQHRRRRGQCARHPGRQHARRQCALGGGGRPHLHPGAAQGGVPLGPAGACRQLGRPLRADHARPGRHDAGNRRLRQHRPYPGVAGAAAGPAGGGQRPVRQRGGRARRRRHAAAAGATAGAGRRGEPARHPDPGNRGPDRRRHAQP